MSTVEIQDLTTFIKDIYSELVKETKELEKKHKTQKQEISTKIKTLISKENESEDIDIVSLAETIENHKCEKEDMDIQHDLDNHMLVKNTREHLLELVGVPEIFDTPEEIEKNKQAAREWLFNEAVSFLLYFVNEKQLEKRGYVDNTCVKSRINKNVLRPEIACYIKFTNKNYGSGAGNMNGHANLPNLNKWAQEIVEIMFEPIE